VAQARAAYWASQRVMRAAKRARTAYQSTTRSFKRGGKTAGQRRKVPGMKTNFAKAVRKVILSTAERCFKSVASDGYSMNHDTLKEAGIWNIPAGGTSLFPSQGNSDSDRRGDEIYAEGIMYRGILQVPADRRNTRIKLWFLEYDTAQGDPGDKTQFFHSISNNVMIDPRNSDRFPKARYLGVFKCNSVDSETDTDKTILIKKWIPLKRKIHFRIDAGNAPTNLMNKGSLIWAPYDTVSTATTDTVVTNVESTYTLYYRDP